MIIFGIGMVVGIGVCSAFCGGLLFIAALKDVPEITADQIEEKLRRRAFYQALYASAKEQQPS